MTNPLFTTDGPNGIHRAGPCPYCRREVRMYGHLFSNTDDGELHTCPPDQRLYGGGYVRWYEQGDWFMVPISPPPATAETPTQEAP